MAREVPEYVTVPREALAALVNYSYPDEEKDYCREDEPEGHIFEHIRVLDEALTAYLRA